MMKLFFLILIINLPITAISQQSALAGLWMLKEKNHLSGSEHANDVPRVINIEQKSGKIAFEYHNVRQGKDTSEFEVLNIGRNKTNEFITPSNRKKVAELYWNSITMEWVKNIVLSEKANLSKSEIKVGEVYRVSPDLEEMTLIKTFDYNDDTVNEDADYTVQAVYEKTTPEKLARDTATGNGVKFIQGLTWKQILNKAKQEEKLIFVDCYATWCLPCKKMDKEIFSLNVVGDEMNKKFISVKVQMDTGKADDQNVKKLYSLARKLESDHKITVLPSYLFLDSEGNILHKGIGFLNRSRFLETLRNAMDSSTQIYALARKAIENQLESSKMEDVARKLTSRQFLEKDLATQIARVYFENYLYTLDEASFFKKIDFFSQFRDAIKSNDSIFRFFLQNPTVVDSISGKGRGFASEIVKSVITREEIIPYIAEATKKGVSPNWDQMEKTITRKYGNVYCATVIVNAKTNWYLLQKKWDLYCDNLETQIGLLGDLSNVSWMTLNRAAWQIFLHSNKRAQLEKALEWSNSAISNQIASKINGAPFKVLLDTYGNLLYKLGRKQEAILFYKNKIIGNGPVYSGFTSTYNKMLRDQPTWPSDNEL